MLTRQATTYLSFITCPPSARPISPEPQTVQMLLHALSTQITYLLHLIPPSANTNLGPTQTLLNLGKTLISSWSTWLNAISAEVNQRAGMFPHSTVENWIFSLDTLAQAPAQQSGTFGWGHPQPVPASQAANALVDSFRGAMAPIRDRFINELGWLIGRRPVNAFGTSMQPSTPTWAESGMAGNAVMSNGSSNNNNNGSNNNNTNEDEEL